MTSMSMNTGRTVIFTARTGSRPAARIVAVRTPAVRAHAPSPVVEWCIGRAPGIVGRFGLALVPFSLLAWMFSV